MNIYREKLDRPVQNSGHLVLLIRDRSTMVIGIGHYGRNITAMTSKKGGIKNLGTVHKQGPTVDSTMKP